MYKFWIIASVINFCPLKGGLEAEVLMHQSLYNQAVLFDFMTKGDYYGAEI